MAGGARLSSGRPSDRTLCGKVNAEAGVDGVIYCSISKPDLEAFQHSFANTPAVVCSCRDMIEGRTHVYFNHRRGGYLATRHLLEMGHRRIALLVGMFGSAFSSA